MTLDHPWRDYDKDRLPPGLTHVLGRDDIEAALRAAGASLGSLSLGRPAADPRKAPIVVVDVYWVGDARSPYLTGETQADPNRLLMRWQAVPAEVRRDLRVEIVDRWLPQACSWAAEAMRRGNVWKATDHRWMLHLTKGALSQTVADY